MALSAQNIISRASIIIQDITNVRWPITEMTNWFNDGRRELAVARPDIYVVTAVLTLLAGARQKLPTGALRLMDVPRNANGAAITITQRGFLDQQNAGWHQMPQSNSIKHFMLDERNPSNFWVYPPATSGAQVEAIFQQAPPDMVPSDILNQFEELYAGALVDYICYRAFSKDAEYAGNPERALAHYSQFTNSIQTGGMTTAATSPNANNIGGAATIGGR